MIFSWIPSIIHLFFCFSSKYLPAMTSTAGIFFFFFSFRVCACLIMTKCAPGDTYCSGNYHRGNFQYFGRCLEICLDRFCQGTTVQRFRDKTVQLCSRDQNKGQAVTGWNINMLTGVVAGLISLHGL